MRVSCQGPAGLPSCMDAKQTKACRAWPYHSDRGRDANAAAAYEYTTHTIFRGRVCPGMSASVSASGSARPRSGDGARASVRVRSSATYRKNVVGFHMVFRFQLLYGSTHQTRGVPSGMHSTATTSSEPATTEAHAGPCAGPMRWCRPCSPQTSDPYGTSRFARYFASPRRGRASQTAQGRTYVHMLIRSANDGVAVT